MMIPLPVLVGMAAVLSAVLGFAHLRRHGSDPAGRALPVVVRALAAVPVPRRVGQAIGGRVGRAPLVAAGLVSHVAAPAVVRARAGGAAVGSVVGSLMGLLAPVLLVFVPVGAVLGRLLPDRAIARRARERQRSIVDALPDLLDLMVICVEAGMALDPALALTSERLGGPLGDEVGVTLADQALGTPRRAAYEGLAARTGSEDVGRLVASLLQAEELGTPLAIALAGQAEALRATRRQRARDRAARAAPRIQLVVALVMVPGAMLLILGVMLMELAGQVGVAMGGS